MVILYGEKTNDMVENKFNELSSETSEHVYNVLNCLKDYIEGKHFISLDTEEFSFILYKVLYDNTWFRMDPDKIIGWINDLRNE